MPSSVRREKPIPDDQWRALAAQNPMRVTYPSWRPKSHWDAKDKADPWKVASGTTDWRKADPRRSRVIRAWEGWRGKPIPTGPPSGMDLRPVVPEYRGADEGTKRRRNSY